MQQLYVQLVQKDGAGQPAGEGCAQRGAEGAVVGDFEEDGEGWVFGGVGAGGEGMLEGGRGGWFAVEGCWWVGGLT